MGAIVSCGTALFIMMSGCSLALAQQTASAGLTEEELAVKEYDPTASLTQFKIQDIYTPAEYGTNAQPNTLQLRPLLAVRPQLFTPLEQLIRPSIQVVTVPRNKGATTTTALDDFQLLDLFVMPWPNEKETLFRWGFGPYLVFPTSTSQFTGHGAWQVGPAWAFSFRQIPRTEYFGAVSAGYFICILFVAFGAAKFAPDSTDPFLSAGPRMVFEVERRNLDDQLAS